MNRPLPLGARGIRRGPAIAHQVLLCAVEFLTASGGRRDRSSTHELVGTLLNSEAFFGVVVAKLERGVILEQAGSGLEKIVVNSLRRAPPGDAPMLAWPLVCGSAVAERTRAVEFAEAVLKVEVPDAGWKRELQALAARYVAMLNRYAGQRVERVKFVVQERARRER
jgi:hypothetical protein